MATRTVLRPGDGLRAVVALPFLDGIDNLLICYRGGHRQGWLRAGLWLADELVETLLELTDRFAIQRAEHLATGATGVHQPRPAHHAEVPGHQRLAELELARDLRRGFLAGKEVRDDSQPGRYCQAEARGLQVAG